MSQFPASDQVFGTTELLEHILIRMPARDVLLSQRVSQQWQAVIKGSLHLQRALLFTGEAADPTEWIEEQLEASDPTKPWFWDGRVVRNQQITYPVCRRYRCHVYGNELLAKVFSNGAVAAHHSDDDLIVVMSTVDPGTHKLRESARRPEASWRRMLVLSPVVVGEAVVNAMTCFVVPEGTYKRVTSTAKGNLGGARIRFGKLWDAAAEARRKEIQKKRASVLAQQDRELEKCQSKIRALGKDEDWLRRQNVRTQAFVASLL
ncbi:hypothetical protein LTR10_013868 [Elasticomyces elasticus]|nr:hypothetical protein LTR10_013868 [Elasticomyces elasticus]KAK4974548.1 hypothetical protein LTR42_005193 [Elasticomyces elasticus]